jgi:hypothetical protein
VYTNSLLGDAGFANSVQRVDLATKDVQTHDFGPGEWLAAHVVASTCTYTYEIYA